MTERGRCESDRNSSEDSRAPAMESSSTKQRRKRKWDQPDESLISAGVAVPGIIPVNNMGSLVGVTWAGVAPAIANIPSMIQAPIMQQAATVVQKLTQPKIQDELMIAREIVINDAEPAIRYKLTKRQTQEEIQKCTGAVVITRGKYRPPNSEPDGEKPLYLHISAGVHLKETAERIIAVDRAAAMVEEMLKHGQALQNNLSLHSSVSSGGKVSQPLSACVYLGFDADPSQNIAARICGPHDQYINHIMNETGATVILRGCGSVKQGSAHEEGLQPLHLCLSSNNPKGLEDARLLAENLMDTISRECGATRISPGKVYTAVPPPQKLLAGVQSTGNEPKPDISSSACLASSLIPAAPASAPGLTTIVPYGPLTQRQSLFNCGQLQPNGISHSHQRLASVTSYSGYGGIYPQATPLQQLALALRQSNAVTSTVSPSTSAAGSVPKPSDISSSDMEKRLPQKRKFQELPTASRETAVAQQGSEMELTKSSHGIGPRNVSTMPPPKKLGTPPSNGMPPLPSPRSVPSTSSSLSKSMPPPPPRDASMMASPSSRRISPPPAPLKSCSSVSAHRANVDSIANKANVDCIANKPKAENVPDTLVKIMEYGEDDDDDDFGDGDNGIYSFKRNNVLAAPKPFWAV
ncbi:hypothetical protein Ancab_005747 [Ancistrocladus abbreviatus]